MMDLDGFLLGHFWTLLLPCVAMMIPRPGRVPKDTTSLGLCRVREAVQCKGRRKGCTVMCGALKGRTP